MAQPIYLDPELQGIERERQLAQALQQRGMKPVEGQMVSGRYVAPAWTQQLANAFDIYSGGQRMASAEKKAQDYASALRTQSGKDIQDFLKGGQAVVPEGQTLRDDEGVLTYGSQMPKPYMERVGALAQSRSPQSQALSQTLMADMLKPRELPEGASLVQMTPEGTYQTIGSGAPKATNEFKNYQEAVKSGYKGSFPEYQFGLKRAGAQNVVLNTEKSYGQAFGQGLAGNDVKLYDSASRAPQMLETVKETRTLLDNDNLYVGFGANQKLDLARAADALGITGKNTADKITNTQRLFAARAQATLDSVKESGLGAGNGFTDKDREFLEKSKLGNIVYSRDALKQQLDIEERVARGLAQKWNTRFGQIPESAKGPTGVTRIELTKSIVEGLNPQDREAYEWATKNPNDPRASQIKRRLGF